MGFVAICCLLYLRFINKINIAFYEVNVQVFRFVERYFLSFLNGTLTESILRQLETGASEEKLCRSLSNSKSEILQDNASTQTNPETPSSTVSMLICKLRKKTRRVTVSCDKSDSEGSSSEYEECDNNCATINDDVVVIDFDKFPYESVKAKWDVNTDSANSFKVFKPKIKAKVSKTGRESTSESGKQSESTAQEDPRLEANECSVSAIEVLSFDNDVLMSKGPSKQCYEAATVDSSETEKNISEHELQEDSMPVSSVKDAAEVSTDIGLESSAHMNLMNTDLEIVADVVQEEIAFDPSVHEHHKDCTQVKRNLSTVGATYFQDPKPKVNAPETKNESTSEASEKQDSEGRTDSYLEVKTCSPSSSEISGDDSGNNTSPCAPSIELLKRTFVDSSESVKTILGPKLHESSMFASTSVTDAKEVFEDKIVESSTNVNLKTDLKTLESVIHEEKVFESPDHESHKDVPLEALIHEISSESKVRLNLSTDRPGPFQDFKSKTKVKAQETENEFTAQACTKSYSQGQEDSYLKVHERSRIAHEISCPEEDFLKVSSVQFCEAAAIGSLETEKSSSEHELPTESTFECLVKAAEELFEDKPLETSDKNLKETGLETLADVVHEEIALDSSCYKAEKDMPPEVPVYDITEASGEVNWNLNTEEAATIKIFKSEKKVKFSETENDSNSEECKISESKGRKYSYQERHDCSAFKDEVSRPENDDSPKAPIFNPCKTVDIASSEIEKATTGNKDADSLLESSESATVEVSEGLNNLEIFANIVKDLSHSPVHRPPEDMELEYRGSPVHETLDDMEQKCSEPLDGKAQVEQPELIKSLDYRVLKNEVLESPKSTAHRTLNAKQLDSSKYPVHKALDDVKLESGTSPANKSLDDAKLESPKSPVRKALEDVKLESHKSPVHKALEDVKLESHKSPVRVAPQDFELKCPEHLVSKRLENVHPDSFDSPITEAFKDAEREFPTTQVRKTLEYIESESSESSSHKSCSDMEIEYPFDEISDTDEMQGDAISGALKNLPHEVCNDDLKFPSPEVCKDKVSEFQSSENIVLKSPKMDAIYETPKMKTMVLWNSSYKASKDPPDYDDNIDINECSKKEISDDNKQTNDFDYEQNILSEQFSGKLSKPFSGSVSDCLNISKIHSEEKLTDDRVEEKSVDITLRNIDLVAESMIGASKVRLKKVNDSEGKFFPLSNAKKSYVLGSDFFTAALEECQITKLHKGGSTTAIEKVDLENLNKIIDELKLLQLEYCGQTDRYCQQDGSSASNQLIGSGVNLDAHTQMTSCAFATEHFPKMPALSDSNNNDPQAVLHKTSLFQIPEVETSAKLTSAELTDFRLNSKLHTYLKSETEEKKHVTFKDQSETLLFKENNACPVLNLFSKGTQTFASQTCRNSPIFDCDKSSFYKHILSVFDPVAKRLNYSEGGTPFVNSEPDDFEISNPKTLPRFSPPPSYDESQQYFSRTCNKTKTKSTSKSNPIVFEVSTSQNLKVDFKAIAERNHGVSKDVAQAIALMLEKNSETATGSARDMAAVKTGSVDETVAGVTKHTAKKTTVNTREVADNTGNVSDTNKLNPDHRKSVQKSTQGTEGSESSKVKPDAKASKKQSTKSKKSKRKKRK